MSIERMTTKSWTARCGINPEFWLDYVEGELDRSLAEDMSLHVQNCSSCRRELRGIRLVKKGLNRPETRVPDDLFFKRLEGKIMQAVEKTHIEAVAPRGARHFKAMATAAVLVLLVGAPFMLPQFRLKSTLKQALPAASMSLEDQIFAMNTGTDPGVFSEVIISHQDSNDFVFEAAAEKLSRMSDQDARTALDQMK